MIREDPNRTPASPRNSLSFVHLQQITTAQIHNKHDSKTRAHTPCTIVFDVIGLHRLCCKTDYSVSEFLSAAIRPM